MIEFRNCPAGVARGIDKASWKVPIVVLEHNVKYWPGTPNFHVITSYTYIHQWIRRPVGLEMHHQRPLETTCLQLIYPLSRCHYDTCIIRSSSFNITLPWKTTKGTLAHLAK